MPYDPRACGAQCQMCPLKGKPVVPPEAPPSDRPVRFILVGEGPGYREENEGKPFIGPSGLLLNSSLESAGLNREDAWVTNSTLCRPENDKDADTAAACCAPRLLGELATFDKSIPIFALGKPAARVILGIKSILMVRGFLWRTKPIPPKTVAAAKKAIAKATTHKPGKSTINAKQIARLKYLVLRGRSMIEGRWVIPTIHPAFVLRLETWAPVMRADFMRFGRLVRGEITHLADRGKHTVVSKPSDVRRMLSRLGKVVAFDIETSGPDPLRDRIDCVGFCDGRVTFVISPWIPEKHAKLITEAF